MNFINFGAIFLLAAGLLTLVVIFIGLGMVVRANRSKIRDNGVVSANIAIGLAWIGVAAIAGGTSMTLIYLFRDTIQQYFNVGGVPGQ